MFPFTWEKKGKRQLSSKEFADIFENLSEENNIWQRNRNGKAKKSNIGIALTNAKMKSFYSAYQFFNEAGRSIVFDEAENEIVSKFQVKEEFLKHGNSQYVITLKDKELKLDIDGIYLKVFNTGIVMFYMECKNYEHRSIEEVKLINEYGRRVSLSFWPKDVNAYKKCADKLSICINNEAMFIDDFRGFVEKVSKDKNEKVSLTYISTIIRGLLCKNGKNIRFRAKEPNSKVNEIQIRPILDGKMYVSCCIADVDAAIQIKKGFDEDTNSFSEKQEINLTELINVDLEGHCAYTNKNERKSFLAKHLYLSEFAGDKPKLLGITEQSCVKIIMPEYDQSLNQINEFEIDYHNNIYNQIVIVGIAQRMTIANFMQEISRISRGIEDSKKKMTNKDVMSIMELQERFVAFQNQFLLFEVTAQREGIYIYNKIQKELHVKEENDTLSSRLSGIYELANINQGYRFNKWALVLSVVALICATFGAINDANTIGSLSFANYSGYAVVTIGTVICSLIIGFVLKKKY